VASSIFWDFTLPNSATWFYFSLFLAVALFFQFSRLLTVRNLDLVTLFLFVPGFLFIQDANALALRGADDRAERYAGYGWLLAASLYWFVRCLVDLASPRRPLVSPNLSPAGLIWFGAVLFAGLVAVAFGTSADPWQNVGRTPAALSGMQAGAAAVMSQARGSGGADPAGDAATAGSARFWVERSLATVCHAAVVAGLFLIGYRLFDDLPTGLAAAALYLLLPYTAYHIGQIHHVWPAGLTLWAVYLYRRPTWAGALLGLAAGTTFFPLFLLPAWAQFYRTRGLARFLLGFAGSWLVGLAATLGVLTWAGQFPDGMWQALHLADWQPWRVPTAESIWTNVYWGYRIPVVALYVAFVLTSLWWPRVRNLGQLVAVSAAVMIGVQFWFADRGGLYVLWYTPLLVVLVLRPNLADWHAVDPGPWPAAVGRVARWAARRVRLPQFGGLELR